MSNSEIEELIAGLFKGIFNMIVNGGTGLKEVIKKRSRIITFVVMAAVIFFLYRFRLQINQRFVPQEYHKFSMHLEMLCIIPFIYLCALGSRWQDYKKKFQLSFESAGLYSNLQRDVRQLDGSMVKQKDYPKYLKEKRDGKCTIYYFSSNGISLDTWKSKQLQLETSMDCNIIKFEQEPHTKRVMKVFTIKSTEWLRNSYRWKDEYISGKDFEVVIGEGLLGRAVIDFESVPHLLIAGETGSGKSVLQNCIIWQIIHKGARVFMVDFKGGIELDHYKDFGPVMWDRKKVINILKLLVLEHEKRVELFKNKGVKKLSEYNGRVSDENKLSRCFLIVDEAAEMLDKDGADQEETQDITIIEGMVKKLARLARAQGIHIIMATQRPDTKVITGQIRNNLTGRISGKMSDKEPSIMALGSPRAVDLPDIKGRFLYKAGLDMTEFQAYFFKTVDIKKGTYMKGKMLTDEEEAQRTEIGSNALDINDAEDQGIVSAKVNKPRKKETRENSNPDGKLDQSESSCVEDEDGSDDISIKVISKKGEDPADNVFKNYLTDDEL